MDDADKYRAAMLGFVLAKEILAMQARNQAVTAERLTEIILENDVTIKKIGKVIDREMEEGYKG